VLMCYLVASMLLSASILSERFVAVTRGSRRMPGFIFGLAHRFITPSALVVIGATIFAVAAAMNYEAARQYLSTGHIALHWSRVLFGGFLVSAAVHLAVTAVLLRMADILLEKQGKA
jgi:hypothetical protein